MFHPVGSQPPSVYWRRRLALLGAIALVLVLVVLTIVTLRSSDSPKAGSRSPGTTTPVGGSPTGSGTGQGGPSTTPGTSPGTSAGTAPGTPGSSGPASAMPQTCSLNDLTIAAVVGKPVYAVGDKPLLQLQVTNTGSAPCVRNLADSQIELKVYNGTSRVWGSHDCAVQPGTDNRTLDVAQPYRFAILWGGKTSEPNCTQATRQQVGAGTYTLYAALAGKTGQAAQFTIS